MADSVSGGQVSVTIIYINYCATAFVKNRHRNECKILPASVFIQIFSVNGLSTGAQYDPTSIFFNKRCLCDAGWTGELCDKSLINRCGPKGEEINGKCVCQKNFIGDRCQYVTQCLHGQLYNGRYLIYLY
jgi:hypothetical protein